MNNRYKIILTNNNIYKEIELTPDAQEVKVGTGVDCDVRLRKELFFEQIELLFVRKEDEWSVICSDNLYLTIGDVRKLLTKDLKHGDTFEVKYQSSGNGIFSLEYMLDFDYEEKEYNREISISNIKKIQIGGGADCEIKINDSFVGSDSLTLQQNGKELTILDNNSRYGIYVNGSRINKKQKLNEFDFFSIAGYSFYFKGGKLYTSQSNNILINNLTTRLYVESTEDFKYPKFNRNTRLIPVISSDAITVLDPPPAPHKPKNNLLMSLLPALGMLVITVLLRGVMGGGGSFVILSACTMGMGMVTSIITFFNGRKEYKKESVERIEKYTNYIQRKKDEIAQLRQEEKNNLDEVYYSFDRKLGMVRDFSGDLFDRTPADPDFLSVLIGEGLLPAQKKIDYKRKEQLEVNDSLSLLPEQMANEMMYIQEAPIASGFKSSNAIGVIGDDGQLYDLMKNMLIDICIRQYQKDVKLAFVVPDSDTRMIEWMRLLPGVQNDDINARNIACDNDSKNLLFEYLYQLLSDRELKKMSTPHYVVFVYNEGSMKQHPVSQFIEKASSLGFTFVFFANNKELLPQGCNQIISINKDGNNGRIIETANSNHIVDFSFNVISDIHALEIATKLAPVYCEEVSLESSLTKNISLFELLHIMSVDDLDLTTRWTQSLVHKSMAAPLGVKTKNEVVYLDLHEKAHGPHGLVAGTTGSGKSELLQSYILSVTTLFHPYEVSFVIIDFKGGGMVNQFKSLPHLVGAITNIDGKEIDRSLQSIKAELEKRQRLFAEAEVNHIDAYIRKYKKKEIRTPIPHLIIIVDEFAELKAEQPEFMKELISAARIGRSLGVHLILATQKPSGQVNEQIWSNSKFKLCLKVQTKEDSSEVIKSPLAAEIKEPGRTYFQVGNNEIFELFQSAYSGSSAKADDDSRSKSFAINEVSLSGKRKNVYHSKTNKTDERTTTQLEAIVEYVAAYCKDKGIEKLPNICLPSLSKLIEYPEDVNTDKKPEITVDIGVYDAPAMQYQGIASFDLGTQNVVLIGSAQYGKTNLLQTIIRELSTKYSPEDVNIYIIDFGSMVLKNFENLHHIGGVVCPSEDEKLKNLFKLLNTEIAIRKNKLMTVGVSSFSSYKEAGYCDIPQIVLIIDNYTALRELYLQEDDVLLPILRDGLAVGISVIIANAQTAGLGYKYMSNLAQRISLYCNDSGEYSSIFDHCKMSPDNVVGRGLIELNKAVYEFQAYLSFSGEKEIDRVVNMREYVETANRKYSNTHAKKIPEIPAILTEDELLNRYNIVRKDSYVVPIGLEYDSISTFNINLLKQSVLGIIGREKSGKNNLLSVIFNQLHRNMFTTPTEMYLIDDAERKLKPYEAFGFAKAYTMNCDDLVEYINEIYDEIKERSIKVSEEGIQAIKNDPLKLIVIRNMDIIASFSKNTDAIKKYKELITQYRNLKICFILVDVEDAPVAFSGPEILKSLKETKKFIYFNNLSEIKFCDVSNATQRLYKKEISLGDAYYFSGNDVKKIKTVKYNGGE